MNIFKTNNKKEYMELLLLGDEQEDMIYRYLDKADMFVLDDNGIKAQCCVTKEAAGTYEIKNISVHSDFQRLGYGRALIEFVRNYYPDCTILLAGTGESKSTLNFYYSLGFRQSHRIKNFFPDNYNHTIFEDGRELIDMVYMKLFNNPETEQ